MKENIRYQIMSIPRKIQINLKLTIDTDKFPVENSYISSNGATNISIVLAPLITLDIVRSAIVEEDGTRTRPPWNKNDALPMTQYSLPVFLRELNGISEDLKIPDLYTYTKDRLELNKEIASKIRRVAQIGQMYTVELSAVVIEQIEEEKRVEGIKLKINNEQSTVLLTLNEIEALKYGLTHIDIDSIALALYMQCANRQSIRTTATPTFANDIDILPKE